MVVGSRDLDREIEDLERYLAAYDREYRLEERLSRHASPRPATGPERRSRRSRLVSPAPSGGSTQPRYMQPTAARELALEDERKRAMLPAKTSFRLAKANALFVQGLRGGPKDLGGFGPRGRQAAATPSPGRGRARSPLTPSPGRRGSPGAKGQARTPEEEREIRRKMLVHARLSQRMLELSAPQQR